MCNFCVTFLAYQQNTKNSKSLILLHFTHSNLSIVLRSSHSKVVRMLKQYLGLLLRFQQTLATRKINVDTLAQKRTVMEKGTRQESHRFIKRISKDYPLKTERFFLRDLTEADASNTWLDWLSDSVAKQFISASTTTANLSALKVYITERLNLDNVRFFGIFDSINGKHIGNIKYEPIDITNNYAIMGVLIGDSQYRGKGVFPEIYKCSSRYIYDTYPVDSIFLGVDSSNISAIKSYEKVGFITTMRHPLGDSHSGIVMLDTSNQLNSRFKHSRT